MSQEDFFAKQEDRFSSFHNLFEHLERLQHLHWRLLVDAFGQRHEAILAPLSEGRLRAPSAGECWEYLVDFGQRGLLFLDALRQRGDNTLAHERAGYPLLLKFPHEVLIDGRDLPRPVNYSLLRILPKDDQPTDTSRQPVIVVDPRGGHGAGIGGFKQDSEIGESLRAGHPTYFIAFSHAPAPGQTLIDIAEAEARFIETVSARHSEAGKPVVIGNCQAGWALMGLAASRPELPGLVIVNGAPMSYWAGVNGRNPMRYSGGLLGGAWMTRWGSDIGNGRFDGTWLVSNFENLNPANTYWTKYYNLFRDVDTETPRFLDFERWWGSPTLLNSEEIEVIVDDLFIGNRLAGGNGRQSSGIDLKRIEAPVVVFCSYGDNITPPQQALNWIADVYPSDLALRSAGRTIVYLRHASIGHLGIFVSGKVARREHRELLGAIDAISVLSPGLYELMIDDLPASASGDQAYQVHFEPRSIADILSDDEDGRSDEREFALVDRVSGVNSTLYDWFVRPWMRNAINEPLAEYLRKSHPFHQQQVSCSSLNPSLWWLTGYAALTRANRRPASPDNPLFAWQDTVSSTVQALLDGYRDVRDSAQEMLFHSIYGGLSTLTGGQAPQPLQGHIEQRDKALIDHLQDSLLQGGEQGAFVRILCLLAHASGRFGKERIEQLAQQARALAQQLGIDPTAIRESVRLQDLLVFALPEESLSSLPLLVPEAKQREAVLSAAIQLVPELLYADGAVGELWRRLHDLLEHHLPTFAQPSLPHIAVSSDSDQSQATLSLSDTDTEGAQPNARPRAKKATQPTQAQVEPGSSKVAARSKSPVAAEKKTSRSKASRSKHVHVPASRGKKGDAE
ncbi:DUF3141 domain-containing protein [Pseudomonas aeruginosa]|uniref:DUF3141 domain-containing protein n=1 Tax=Pseudomonas aeruginosa TaxID=287 RepID=UPI0015573022|nr:DUF3141 domain-containing protein [Pseudomonas aeruginosa]MBW6124040.1 DUF3141 domain-containing protein [Pseudomonas aeruginosa]MCV3954620.1 DUF3141 domain-containing protein [Pseudomonas aeruginosa]QKF01883.1 DUF3141 domain-containing protein [Pseudomonas aeruginosa]HBO2781260.1 DUF3141 domain-containing protein [Pseudomonas aeruginosa]HBP5169539.1 DUF3141 domain-containing protein [Pseudomonas aeruginosa]